MIAGMVIGAIVGVASAAAACWAWLIKDFEKWW
jgi:hypothetical protein